jgi:DNA-binding CsgD family transcriptional regulator
LPDCTRAQQRLWEREEALAEIAAVLDCARANRGQALFIVGQAGLGKTSLLTHARRLAATDFRIAGAAGFPMESSIPYGLGTHLLESLGAADALHSNPGTGSSVRRDTDQFDAVMRWRATTSRTPILLTLDDLHLADQESLALLSFLTRRVAGLPVAIIGAARPWPASGAHVAARLELDGRASVRHLQSLSMQAARCLLIERAGVQLAQKVIEQAWSSSGGNPLLLEQIAAALAGGTELPVAILSAGDAFAQERLLARFAGLPATALRAVEVASVFGTRFRPEHVRKLAQLEQAECDRVLESLWRGGLVRGTDGPWLEFVHPLFARAAYGLLGPARAGLEARVIELLLHEGLEDEAVRHALLRRPAGNPAAIRLLERLGRDAHVAGAVTAAIEYLEVAAELAAARPPAGLALRLGQALLDGGRLHEAITVLDALRSYPELDCGLRVGGLLTLSTALEGVGAREEAAERRNEARVLVSAEGSAAGLGALVTESLSHWFVEGPSALIPLVQRAQEVSGNHGVSDGRKTAWATAFMRLLSGDPSGLGVLEESACPVVANPWSNVQDALALWGVVQSYALALMVTERLADCDRICRVVRATAEHAGAPLALATITLVHSQALARMGRLAEARAVADSAVPMVRLLPALGTWLGATRAYIELHLGLHRESARRCQEIERAAAAGGNHLALLQHWDVVGMRELRGGRPGSASDTYRRLESCADSLGIGDPCLVMWERHAVEAHLAAGRRSDAERVVGCLQGRAARSPARWPGIALSCGRAWLADMDGARGEAEGRFATALALHDQAEPMPLEKVETLLGYGSFLRRAGQPALARPLLRSATQLAENVGTDWLARYAAGELRITGGRRPARATSHGGLTGQEQRVAELAAQGASNREIAGLLHLSINTIETHLRHVFDKLGIRSRRQLIARESRRLENHGDP